MGTGGFGGIGDMDDDTWRSLMPGAAVFVLIYVFGIPLFVGYVLQAGYELSEGRTPACWLGRDAHLLRGMFDPAFKEAFGPLYQSYHRHSCKWEITIMMRKVMLVLVTTFLSDAPNIQALAPALLEPSPQRERGSHMSQPVLVAAGPGTGKTWSSIQLSNTLGPLPGSTDAPPP